MIKAVIFDFDGTLINTNKLIRIGLNKLANKHMGRLLTEIELMTLNGKHINKQISYIVNENVAGELESFKSWYQGNHDRFVETFPGIKSLLETLDDDGIIMGIVTNNSRVPLEKGLDHLRINHFFKTKVTCEDVYEAKPAPEGLYKILKELQLEHDEVLFVGDSPSDINAAKRANITSCLVDWSILNDLERHVLAPDHIITDPQDLVKLIKKMNTMATIPKVMAKSKIRRPLGPTRSLKDSQLGLTY